jgi:release factor glutamine methyltransferase
MAISEARAWTVRDLMNVSIRYLQEKGFSECRLSVELLLAFVLKIPRIQLYTGFDRPIQLEELEQFRSLFERRLRYEPVQYITGESNFMGLRFAVVTGVLIPRPETETLVEQLTIQCKNLPKDEKIFLFEVGTGSGSIAISIAKYIPNIEIVTIDTNEKALEIAKQNAERYNVEKRIEFLQLDIFSEIDRFFTQRFHFVISNPPYIAEEEWDTLQPEIRLFEPKEALVAKDNGLAFLKRIILLAPYLLITDGKVFLEVGYNQAEEVSNFMEANGYNETRSIHDLQGVKRVVSGSVTAKIRGV